MPEIDDALLHHIVRRVVPFLPDDYEDWVQEAMIARWLHRDKPKPKQYAAIMCDLIDLARKQFGRNDAQRDGRKLIHAIYLSDSLVAPAPQPDRDRIIDFKLAWRRLRRERPKTARMMAERAAGLTWVEIGHRHGYTDSYVCHLVKQGRLLLRVYGAA